MTHLSGRLPQRLVCGPLNANSFPAGDFSLAEVELRGDQDLVFLIQRIRAAGAALRLQAREIRSLSAATYELGRLLMGSPGLTAEVSVAGASLVVVYRRPVTDADTTGVGARIRQSAAPLHRMVNRIEVEETHQGVLVALRVDVAGEGTARPQTRTLPAPAVPGAEPEDLSPAELRRQYDLLRQSYRDLQSELNETNRGVVALHAELEAQANELRQAEDRLRLLLDNVQDYAICMLTPNGDVASWNAGAQRLFGYSAEEIIGRSHAGFYAPGERELDMPSEQLRRARVRGRLARECQQVRQGGGTFDAHVTLTAVRRQPDGELRGFALVVRDMTERKRLENDLRRRAEDLAAANRAKEEFLATLSHELRTPLNAMLGWTSLLRIGKLNEAEMARALETIERNARVQEQLIADILDVSRIVTGKLRVELRPIELEPIIEAAVDAVRPAAEAKGVYLTLDQPIPATVLGDPDRLQQVIWNLLVNAIKFTPPQGLITVRMAQTGPTARVIVADTGEGVSPELLPVIFDRFTQGDASATRPHGGLGLGLSIVRHIVELHGGRVQAHSEGVGRGATFTVDLPLRAVRQVATPEPPPQPLRGIRVLIVDDDADAREVVTLALEQCGAETAAAASASEALTILPEFRPDVLISDLGMPGEDGYALIRRVRALGAAALRDVPAVALTGYAKPEDRRRALGAGFQKFVPKPVEIHELAAVVRTLV
jgi:PAS domain S-box-containing protein